MPRLNDKLIERISRMHPPRTEKGDEQLRASLRKLKWLPQFPAYADERGQVLVGNRRMRLAQELGIRPVVTIITFGDGTMADIRRTELAIASNIGTRANTRGQRQEIARYLAEERSWDIPDIAQAMGLTAKQVEAALRGPGTAKSTREGKRGKSTPKLDRARDIVRPMLDESQTVSPHTLEKEHPDISHVTFDMAIAAENAAREARQEVDPASLPKSWKERFDSALRQAQKRLERDFDERISKGVQAMLKQVLPQLKAREVAATRTMKAYKGVMQRPDFVLVLSCLHPDSRANVSDEKLTRAFQLVKTLEPTLLSGADLETIIPASSSDLRRSRNGMGGA